ncbi:hypothetical protein GF359_05010 [candidate division WOR-3 bacterium]|uniref:Uncharacterized protein n=1 Tax=candidate division WOR-3 bacterium TaxID=2052148 RepID=A0A9D5KAH1_UNCW3|nr:hypothetical protein [candidate division WOR-3 bacterium]MBD3364555.1 hypothetical protein [candidate division WOR-3 bacterium]
MSLPYGPLMRGLAVSWCYDRIEEGLSSLQNPSQAMVFTQGSRVIGRERLDPRAVLMSQGPTAVLHVGSIILSNAAGYGGRELIYDKGTIVHTGTGTEEVSLTGSHAGNNRFVIEITASGTVGTDGQYQLRKTPWTGSDWGTEAEVSSGEILVDGKIAVSNGFIFCFEVGQSVVAGDTYSWETAAYRVLNRRIRDAVIPVTVEIEVQTEDEAVGEGGYVDQLMLMFAHKRLTAELYDGHYEEVKEEMTSMSVTPVDQGEQRIYRIDLVIKYTGKVFMADVSPLITLTEYEDPEIYY